MKADRSSTEYTLGASVPEQSRLSAQLALYGGSCGVTFSPGERVCELGCGPGINLWIASQTENGSYVGVDSNAAQIETATRLATELGLVNVQFQVGDARDTKLPDSGFDAVFCRCLLVHLQNPEKVMDEAYRLLRPGGVLYLLEPDDESVRTSSDLTPVRDCWRARLKYLQDVLGIPKEGAIRLHELMLNSGFEDVNIKIMPIVSSGSELNRLTMLIENWLSLVERVKEPLIQQGFCSETEIGEARNLISQVSLKSVAAIDLWRMSGVKPVLAGAVI